MKPFTDKDYRRMVRWLQRTTLAKGRDGERVAEIKSALAQAAKTLAELADCQLLLRDSRAGERALQEALDPEKARWTGFSNLG